MICRTCHKALCKCWAWLDLGIVQLTYENKLDLTPDARALLNEGPLPRWVVQFRDGTTWPTRARDQQWHMHVTPTGRSVFDLGEAAVPAMTLSFPTPWGRVVAHDR